MTVADKVKSALSDEQQSYIVELCDRLLALAGSFTRGTFIDAVAWVDVYGGGRLGREPLVTLRTALIGNALKFTAAFGMEEYGESHVTGTWLDYNVRRAFGLSETDFKYDPGGTQITEFLDRMSGQIFGQWREYEPMFNEVDMTIIVEPGYPWPCEFYYSAKKGKWIEPQRPAWLVDVPVDKRDWLHESGPAPTTQPGVNPCVVFTAEDTKTNPYGPVFGTFDDGTEMMVAHSMSLLTEESVRSFHKHVDTAVENIRGCGGLLFPSLSVGAIPATNFGPVVLVGHLELVLASLKPYKERGRAPSWVYATDTWTVGTAQLMKQVSLKLFDEFHGHDDWIYGRCWALGPPADPGPHPGSDATAQYADPLQTTSQLRKAIRKRLKFWHRDMDEVDFLNRSEQCAGTDCAYGYCEAKAREVVSLDEFPYLIAPDLDDYRKVVKRFVDGTGYKGKTVFLATLGGARWDIENNDYARYDWAWVVNDAVKKLAPVTNIR